MSTYEVDGMRYHVTEAGAGEPLVLLHGFTGSALSWDSMLPRLSHHYRMIAIDLPGHGDTDSPVDVERYRMERVADDLIRLIGQLDIEAAHWLGYSMGGRLALYITLNDSERVRSAILVSASPGVADPHARQIRRRDDESLAERIETQGVASFVDEWQQHPLLAQDRLPDTTRRALRAQRLRNNARGLANSLRGMGSGAQPSLWHRLGEIERPVLLLAGEHDDKFVGINRQMMAAIPDATIYVVPQAGHMLHLEQQTAFGALVLDFLSTVASEDGRQPLPQGKQGDEEEGGQRQLLEPRV